MAKCYIYIDDSGDPGLSATSSRNFVIASVVVVGKEAKSSLEQALKEYRRQLMWGENKELKFHKTKKDILGGAIRAVADCDFRAYAMIFCKKDAPNIDLPVNSSASIMIFVIKELLCKLALDDAEVVIDGTYGQKFLKRVRPYLRQQLMQKGIVKCKVRFADSKKDILVQLADITAGAVSRSLGAKKMLVIL